VQVKGLIGAALDFVLPLWEHLAWHVTDGRYLIDNNSIKNAIRSLVLGRRNYLLSETKDEKLLVLICSLTGSCKLKE